MLRDLLLTTPSAPLRNGIFLLVAQPPLSRNCASNSFIFSRHKTGAVSFCFWSGRRTVGILLENGGEWSRLATNTIPGFITPSGALIVVGRQE
jgi:hypothetical protein